MHRKAETNDNVTIKSNFAFDLLVFSYDVNQCTGERDNGFSYSHHRTLVIQSQIKNKWRPGYAAGCNFSLPPQQMQLNRLSVGRKNHGHGP